MSLQDAGSSRILLQSVLCRLSASKKHKGLEVCLEDRSKAWDDAKGVLFTVEEDE